MRFQCLVCLLLASMAYGQAAQPSTPNAAAPPAAGAKADQSAPAATDKAPEIKVGPDDTVLTLKGFCADATQQGDACKTVISRAQFEKLAESLQPGMSPAIRRQLATVYSRILRMSTVAEKRGLDKQPKFEEKMNYARMQVLSGVDGVAGGLDRRGGRGAGAGGRGRGRGRGTGGHARDHVGDRTLLARQEELHAVVQLIVQRHLGD